MIHSEKMTLLPFSHRIEKSEFNYKNAIPDSLKTNFWLMGMLTGMVVDGTLFLVIGSVASNFSME